MLGLVTTELFYNRPSRLVTTWSTEGWKEFCNRVLVSDFGVVVNWGLVDGGILSPSRFSNHVVNRMLEGIL